MRKIERLKSLYFSLALSIIASLLSYAYIALVTPTSPLPFPWWAIVGIPLGFFILVSLVAFIVLSSSIVAYTSLFIDGKFRGFWWEKRLDKQIIDNYRDSSEIEIKVTRGYDLIVNTENTNFYPCVNDPTLLRQDKRIKLLMHHPCAKSSHLSRRAFVHHQNLDDFLLTWFDVIIASERIHADPHKKLTIDTRLYTDEHSKWRFYIFHGNKNETLFANYYDADSGSKTPMLKIQSGYQSLYKHFHRYFDDIWDSPSNSMDAYDYLTNHFGKTDNVLTHCAKCDVQDRCTQIQRKGMAHITSAGSFPLRMRTS